MQKRGWLILALIALTAATVSFHYGFLMPKGMHVLHAIHGRLCYIPIILGAVWFGVRGGLAVAIAIALLTLPYTLRISDHHSLVGEYTEMVFYLAIGLMTGVLIEREWRERERRVALQRELARSERLSSLGQMAAGLAHEIRNPLGSIQGVAELLGDDAPEGSKKRELFDVLRKESKRLGTVVDDFLGFARPRPLSLAAVDIAGVMERAAAQMRIDASGRGVRIETRAAPGLPVVQADAEQLHQVFLNLLLNAIAASPDHGRVEVHAERAHRDGTAVVAVTVADHGAGIPADVLPRVFDPFFTTREKGTGLGLSISHTIIADHGGWIDIDSTEGHGCTVRVALPVEAK
ncbi:MAG TPA: ATP-binding protein [Candidatus Krumholzibacteria bacterium]